MMRTLLKDCKWPSLYWAPVPILDVDTNTSEQIDFPFLLPHEFLSAMIRNHPSRLKHFVPDSKSAHKETVDALARQLHMPPSEIVPVGLHGDGVPFKAKMSDSLEQLSWNPICVECPNRMLFTAVPKKFVDGTATWDALLEVFSWSMRCLATGKHPRLRHDGTPFVASSDKVFDTNIP